MSKPYRPIDEITEVFGITLPNARNIIKKFKVDTFFAKGKLHVHVNDFYKAYTKNFNPSLFAVGSACKWVRQNTIIFSSK